jgi:choline transport protein
LGIFGNLCRAHLRGLMYGGNGVHVSVQFRSLQRRARPLSYLFQLMLRRAPTTGGQYHWVSEFAPKSAQKFLSYLVGWLCVLGWQAGTVAVCFLAAQMIQGLAILNYTEVYTPQRWHLTLIVIAICTLCNIFNTVFMRQLPVIESIVLVLHIVGFLVILVTLWTTGERGNPTDVFFTFTDGGGWGNIGLSCVVGSLTPVFSLLGPGSYLSFNFTSFLARAHSKNWRVNNLADSATHISEELRNASKTLPRAIVATVCLNGAMGFVMIITYCMVLGDIDSVLATQTAQPFIQVLFNATQSHVGTSIMTTIMIMIVICGVLNNIAVSSRQLWAFARDKGVPFHHWFARVREGWDVPLNAILLTYTIAVLLSLINIGSSVVSILKHTGLLEMKMRQNKIELSD